MALHLRAAMRAIEAHDGRCFHTFSIAWAKRRVLEAASPVTDPNAQLSVAIKRADAKVSVSRGVRIR